jgi:putative addiction module component (TIGR02574 family)
MGLRDELVRQALTLPAEDRAYVADLLEGSLDARDEMSPDLATEWSQEIDRRIQAYDRGETAARDFDVAMQSMRDAIASLR